MATLEEMQTAISDVLQDDVFSSDRITALLNQGIRFCATVVLLPKLETSGTVDTVAGVGEVEIPASWSFERDLYYCKSVDDTEIAVLDSIGMLIRHEPDYISEQEAGPVEWVCVRANHLVYYPVPAGATELTCNFYKAPDPLVSDADIPSCLPLGFQEELLVNFVLWKCFSEIEDGFEGPKNNTQYYHDLFNVAISSLDTVLNHGQSRCRPNIPNGWI